MVVYRALTCGAALPADIPLAKTTTSDGHLARNKYDRHRRVFKHGRRGVPEEQLVARAAAHAHDDEIMRAFLSFGENCVACRHVRVDDGFCPDVAVVGHLDYIFHDGLLLPTCAEGATLAAIACGAGGNVERSQRAAAGAGDGDGGVGSAPRYLVSCDRNEDVQRTSLRLAEVIAIPGDDGERALKCRSDPADAFIKEAAFAARILDPDKQEIIAFFRLLRDCFLGVGALLANRDVDQRGLAVAVVRRFGLVGGRLDGFLGAIACLLLQFLFVFGLVLLLHRPGREWYY